MFWIFSTHPQLNESPTESAIQHKLALENEKGTALNFGLEDPGDAPQQIRGLVQLGYQIMINTEQNAKEYVGNRLSCTNCHFAGGISSGNKGDGLSLAGVAAKYPLYNERAKKVINLPTRINNCFERSMNGKPLPLDSKEMLALETYFHWISKGFPIYEKAPWLSMKIISQTYQVDATRGERIFESQCSLCHGNDGNGDKAGPPVWGDGSFNNGAGMANRGILSTFIFENMPYGQPCLSEESALDVAEYLLSKPRPRF